MLWGRLMLPTPLYDTLQSELQPLKHTDAGQWCCQARLAHECCANITLAEISSLKRTIAATGQH